MPEPVPVIRWTSWPLREEWPGSILKLLFLAAICGLFVLVFGELGWLATPLLLLTLARWILPSRIAIGPDGVSIAFCGLRTAHPWSRFRRYYAHRVGVHLSPFEAPSPLDPFRGQFLRFSGNRDAVVAALGAAGLRPGTVTPGGSAPPPPGDPGPSAGEPPGAAPPPATADPGRSG